MTSLKFFPWRNHHKYYPHNVVFLIKTITYEEEKVEQLEAVLRHHHSAVDNHLYLFNGHLIWDEKKGNVTLVSKMRSRYSINKNNSEKCQ